jgi:hypothetical protein
MVRWWGIKGLKERRALDEPALYCSMLGAMEHLSILSGYQFITACQPNRSMWGQVLPSDVFTKSKKAGPDPTVCPVCYRITPNGNGLVYGGKVTLSIRGPLIPYIPGRDGVI